MELHRRVRLVLAGATGLVTIGLLLLLGLDGTWWWCAARIVVIGSIAVLATRVILIRSRRAAAAVAVALAVVTLPVGATIALRHLQVTGWSLEAVAGVMIAAGALVLGVVGTTVLIRSLHGWSRLAVPVGALVVILVVMVPLTFAVATTNVPRAELGDGTPADHDLDHDDVTFTTSDGVQLSGWYLPSRNGAAVVVLHGASSTRTAVLDHAAVLARNGFGVLLFDARGMGRSEGRAMNLGWYGDRDISAALDFLAQRPEVDPNRLGALGESMGGEEALGAMAADQRLRAVVAEGATNRVRGDLGWLSRSYGVRGTLQQGMNVVTGTLTDLFTSATPPITLRAAVEQAAPRPALLIAAGSVADEVTASDDIRDASPQSVETWVVPGARHTGGLDTEPDEWERRVTGFLTDALSPSR